MVKRFENNDPPIYFTAHIRAVSKNYDDTPVVKAEAFQIERNKKKIAEMERDRVITELQEVKQQFADYKKMVQDSRVPRDDL